MTKRDIRKIYNNKRLSLSEPEYAQLNHQLCEMFFFHTDLSFTKVLHTFLPIAKNKEPDTWLIIDRITREFPTIRLAVPRVNNQTGEIESFFFEGAHHLKENTWGILEPEQGIPVEPGQIDMALVPLLAFDKNGNRVGYGKGFYDKFLSTCRKSCQKIGISLFPPIDRIDDIDDYDQPLTLAITPQGVTMPAI